MKRREFIFSAVTICYMPTSVFASNDTLIVNRSESCGCCGAWVDRMRFAGFQTEINLVSHETLESIKTKLGISYDLSSCHTAMIGDYFIEGHVPAEDIRRLLSEKPEALGLSVPGMPIGSPGMEMGSNKEFFETLLVLKDGRTQVFNSHS